MGNPNTLPIYPYTIKDAAIQILNGNASNEITLLSAGANSGSRIDVLSACSNDSNAVVLNIVKNNGNNSFPLGCVNVPANSGMNANNAAVDLLAALSQFAAVGSIFLETGWSIKISAQTTVTANKAVTIAASYGNY